MLAVIFYLIIGAAIGVMLFALVQALRLLALAKGGYVGRAMKILTSFVAVFLLGYLAAPLMTFLPAEFGMLLTATVFLLGAVFVALVLSLLRALVKQVFEELGS